MRKGSIFDKTCIDDCENLDLRMTKYKKVVEYSEEEYDWKCIFISTLFCFICFLISSVYALNIETLFFLLFFPIGALGNVVLISFLNWRKEKEKVTHYKKMR